MAVTVMQRYEMKYLLSGEQADFLRRKLEGYMKIDKYGLTQIASLYYDTPDVRLIRASLEKPAFKEKLRLRSYGLASDTSPVFLELKRKCDGIVYKRRVQTTVPDVKGFFAGGELADGDLQIRKELQYFRDYYQPLIPACLVIYDREAYYESGGNLRLTIDYRPRFRMDGLTLTESMEGIPLLEDGWSILEVKVQGAMPLWLSAILSEGRIFKAGFSKYGEAYRLRELKIDNDVATMFSVMKLTDVA
ncbi:MAG: polyphosphate polymerase domain-containing protein [Lachnospiraceae bacterium]|nr:polyphosphate polymerase domain-containing protein [Lachnospiraceae bacterium]